MRKDPVQQLRLVSILEGISYLLLLGVGMPLKYYYSTPLPNKILGMGHGILTIVFVIVLLNAWSNKKIELGLALQTFVASLIPFGAFYMEGKLKKLQQS